MIAMLLALSATSLTPSCAVVVKYVQAADATVSTVMAVKDQYGCEIEQGKHKYSAAGDLQLQRDMRMMNIMLSNKRKAASDPKDTNVGMLCKVGTKAFIHEMRHRNLCGM